MFLNLDLDGVFADFASGAEKVLGRPYEALPCDWKVIDKEENFFRTLLPFKNAQLNFYMLAAQLGIGSTRILTAVPNPTNCLVTAPEDKISWVRRYLDSTVAVCWTSGWAGKLAYCNGPYDILIDDSSRNIDAWREVGGTGIVYRGSYSDALTDLRYEISKLQSKYK